MISFGIDLVAGKNRVPKPATGKIGLVTLRFILFSRFLKILFDAFYAALLPCWIDKSIEIISRNIFHVAALDVNPGLWAPGSLNSLQFNFSPARRCRPTKTFINAL